MWTPDTLQLARIQFGSQFRSTSFPGHYHRSGELPRRARGCCYARETRSTGRSIILVQIFAVNFGMGVVSGLVMAYEFGTNWSHFSAFAGGITGRS